MNYRFRNPEKARLILEQNYLLNKDPQIYVQYLVMCRIDNLAPSICRCGNSSFATCLNCEAGVCESCNKPCGNCNSEVCMECPGVAVPCQTCHPDSVPGCDICDGHDTCPTCASLALDCFTCPPHRSSKFCTNCVDYIGCSGCGQIVCEHCGFFQCRNCHANLGNCCINEHECGINEHECED